VLYQHIIVLIPVILTLLREETLFPCLHTHRRRIPIVSAELVLLKHGYGDFSNIFPVPRPTNFAVVTSSFVRSKNSTKIGQNPRLGPTYCYSKSCPESSFPRSPSPPHDCFPQILSAFPVGLFVYYESMKRKIKIKPVYECRCDGRLQTNRFTRLSYTGLVVELEHLKIKTTSVKGLFIMKR
jgi:hypothetical protein